MLSRDEITAVAKRSLREDKWQEVPKIVVVEVKIIIIIIIIMIIIIIIIIIIKEEKLKRETESPIIAAQDQAIRTNYLIATLDRSQDDPKCRMCKQNNETISHIVSGCPKLAQMEYKKRHDNVARAVHWDHRKIWV